MLRRLPRRGKPLSYSPRLTSPAPSASAPGSFSPAPLGAAFAFTFINSIGTYVVTSSGLFFLTTSGYGFSETDNYLLAVLLGISYVIGAKFASRLRVILGVFVPGISLRGTLIFLMAALGVLCLLPWVARRFAPDGAGGSWPIWVTALLYSPLMGMLWPVVESYVSGGRSDHHLRATMSRWNVVWSAAGVVSTFLIAPLVTEAPALAIALIALAHALAAGFLVRFAREPAEHISDHHEPHPPVYARLLVTFRWLLPMGYVVSSALGPYLPFAASKMKLTGFWPALLPIAWLGPRVLTFLLIELWHGWHGRWYTAVVSGLTLVGSFALSICATLLPAPLQLPSLLAGLALFGASMAVIYTAALYYAMEVGKAEVDAGGTHEALIGIGYTVGPCFGLIASMAVAGGFLRPELAQPLVLAGVLALACAVAGLVASQVRKVTRSVSPPPIATR